jgi:hypothetical protein
VPFRGWRATDSGSIVEVGEHLVFADHLTADDLWIPWLRSAWHRPWPEAA